MVEASGSLFHGMESPEITKLGYSEVCSRVISRRREAKMIGWEKGPREGRVEGKTTSCHPTREAVGVV